MKRPIQLNDGDSFTIANGDIYRDVCCQCQATHLSQLTISGPDGITVTTWVDGGKKKKQSQCLRLADPAE